MWFSSILYVVVLVLLAVWLYKYATYKPDNFPPGPIRLPIWGSYVISLMQNWNFPHFTFQSWANKYGPVFGFYFGDIPCVVTNDYDTCKEVLNRTEFDGKPDIVMARIRNINQKKLGIFFTDGQFWHEQRRFTLRHLRDYGFGRRFETLERLFGEQINHVIEFVKYAQPTAKNRMFQAGFANVYVSYNCTFDTSDVLRSDGCILLPDLLYPIMLNGILSIFGKEPEDAETDGYRNLRKIGRSTLQLQHGMFGIGAINIAPWLKYVAPKISGYQDLIESNEVLFPFIKNIIESIKKSKVDEYEIRNFYDKYINKMKQNEETENFNSFSDDQLLMLTIDYMFPATSAVPVIFVQVLYCLLNHPQVIKKMQAEIDEVVGRGRLPTLDDRKDLPYTDAVIRETMRRETLVPIGILHRVVQDTTLRGYSIPKDAILFTSLYGAHMDEKVWGDPENYRPERFIDCNGKMVKKDYSIPFGAGKRLCAGETFARNSLFLLVSGIFQNFTFELPSGVSIPKLENKVPGVINSQKDICWVKAIPRD